MSDELAHQAAARALAALARIAAELDAHPELAVELDRDGWIDALTALAARVEPAELYARRAERAIDGRWRQLALSFVELAREGVPR